MTDETELAPEPGILVESLRDIGYSFNSALADIMDNSITACASRISVFALPVADSFKVAIIDDVISTGSSIEAIEKLVKESGGEVIARAAVLAEGDAADRTDIIYLEKIPLFFHNKK